MKFIETEVSDSPKNSARPSRIAWMSAFIAAVIGALVLVRVILPTSGGDEAPTDARFDDWQTEYGSSDVSPADLHTPLLYKETFPLAHGENDPASSPVIYSVEWLAAYRGDAARKILGGGIGGGNRDIYLAKFRITVQHVKEEHFEFLFRQSALPLSGIGSDEIEWRGRYQNLTPMIPSNGNGQWLREGDRTICWIAFSPLPDDTFPIIRWSSRRDDLRYFQSTQPAISDASTVEAGIVQQDDGEIDNYL